MDNKKYINTFWMLLLLGFLTGGLLLIPLILILYIVGVDLEKESEINELRYLKRTFWYTLIIMIIGMTDIFGLGYYIKCFGFIYLIYSFFRIKKNPSKMDF